MLDDKVVLEKWIEAHRLGRLEVDFTDAEQSGAGAAQIHVRDVAVLGDRAGRIAQRGERVDSMADNGEGEAFGARLLDSELPRASSG